MQEQMHIFIFHPLTPKWLVYAHHLPSFSILHGTIWLGDLPPPQQPLCLWPLVDFFCRPLKGLWEQRCGDGDGGVGGECGPWGWGRGWRPGVSGWTGREACRDIWGLAEEGGPAWAQGLVCDVWDETHLPLGCLAFLCGGAGLPGGAWQQPVGWLPWGSKTSSLEFCLGLTLSPRQALCPRPVISPILRHVHVHFSHASTGTYTRAHMAITFPQHICVDTHTLSFSHVDGHTLIHTWTHIFTQRFLGQTSHPTFTYGFVHSLL